MTKQEFLAQREAGQKRIGEFDISPKAYLSEADLRGADLSLAYLRWANLSVAYLSLAHLSGANLSEADLRWANLSGANLSGANLSGADLSEANLSEAKINWMSRDLIAGIGIQWAGGEWEKIKVSGGILISRNWCWDKFILLINGKEEALAGEFIAELQKWIQDGDNAPEFLRNYGK